jgi:hypothetical protein
MEQIYDKQLDFGMPILSLQLMFDLAPFFSKLFDAQAVVRVVYIFGNIFMFVSSPISLVKESSLLVKCQFWMVYTKHLQEIPSHGKKRWFPVDFPNNQSVDPPW